MGSARHTHLDPAECLRLLGLPQAASVAEIKHAYRLLAQQFHPDKAGANEVDRQHFLVIGNAYRCLMQTARLIEKGKSVGRCCVCREFGEAVISLDGMTRCPDCALRPGGRLLLPLPALTVVKCVSAFILVILAIGLLVEAIRHESMRYAMGAVAAGAVATVALAAICLRVVYCLQPHEKAAMRAAQHKTARR